MKNQSQTDEEILVEMEEIDKLELKGGISAAPRNKIAKQEIENKPKYKLPGLSKDELKFK